MKLYLDTSVIGAVFDKEMPSRQKATRKLFEMIRQDKHTGIISNIVLEEIDRAATKLKENLLGQIRQIPFQVAGEDEASADLFDAYEKEGFIRKTARLDLRHIALATVCGADAIVSWNFHDIVNIITRRAVHAVNIRQGFSLIEIVSPEEVIEHE